MTVMDTARWNTPTERDWFTARLALLDQDLIRRVGPQEIVVKDAADIVPGDGFVSRGRAYECTGFTTSYGALGLLTIPRKAVPELDDRHPVMATVADRYEAEHLIGTMLLTWRTRRINYGLVRCSACWCNVGRDHTPEDCLLLQQERAAKMSED